MMLTDLAYPLQIVNGNLKIVTGDEVIKQHIRSWLETEPQERVMRIAYGTENFLFDSSNNWDIVAIDLKRSLTREIPEASFDISINPTDIGDLNIVVNWETDIKQIPLEYTVGM